GAQAGAFGWAGMGAAQDHFDGHEAIELEVPGLVDRAHAATTQDRQDFITRHLRKMTAGSRGGGLDVARFQGPVDPGGNLGHGLEGLDLTAYLLDQVGTILAQFLGRDALALLAEVVPAEQQFTNLFGTRHGEPASQNWAFMAPAILRASLREASGRRIAS